MNSPLRTRILTASIAVFLGLPTLRAHALSLQWDVNTGTSGAQDGNGIWAADAGNWTSITPGNYGNITASNVLANNQTFTNGDIAIFGASSSTAWTVTVDGSVQATSIGFTQNSRYVLSGGTIELIGAASIISNFAGGTITSVPQTTINSTLTGSAGLTWTALGSLTLGGTNTYTGTTTFSNSGAGTVNTLRLDFSTVGAPASDILYHGVAAGALTFSEPSNNISSTVFVQGAAAGTNSQRFGNVTVGSTASGTKPLAASLTVASGVSNTTDLTLGTIARIGVNKTLAITAPASGIITAGNANGLVGTWATLASVDGFTGGWLGVTGNAGSGGTADVFTGDLAHTTGVAISALGGYATTSNLTIASSSTGTITQAAGTTQLNTISMTDTVNARTVAIGTGNTLRLGETGGVQIIAGAGSLTVGTLGDAGTLTAGNAGVSAAPATTDLTLTNMSSAGNLIVNSVIANNGAHATNDVVNVVVNGMGKVVLAGENTYTGTTTIHHGVLEVQSNGALGTSAGGLVIMNGGELQLSGDITIADAITAAGLGVNNTGSIHNISGTNTISGVVNLGSPGNGGLSNRFTSDGGTLIFDTTGALPNASGISGGNGSLYISGAGDIVIKNRLTTGAGSTVKEGTGTLFLDGENNATFIVNGGKVRASRATALGLTSVSHTLNDGHLEIINLTGAAEVHNVINFRSLLPGRGNLVLTPGSGTLTVNIGNYSRATGSTLDYTTAAGATLNTTTINPNGILSGGFTVDKNTWATSAATQTTNVAWVNSTDTFSLGGLANGTQVSFSTAPTGLTNGTVYYVVNSTGSSFQVATTLGGTAIVLTTDGISPTMNQAGAITGLSTGSYSTTFTTNANVDVAAGTTTQGAVTVNTLRFNNAGAATVALTGNLTLTSSGGILVTSAVGANDVTLRSNTTSAMTLSGGDLILHQHNTLGRLILGDATNPLNIGSGITTITKTGAGEVVLRGTAAASGINVRIHEGTFTVEGSERFIGASNANFTIGSSTSTAKVVFGNAASGGTETINTITPGVLSGSSLVGGGAGLYTLTVNNSGTQDWTNLKVGGTGTNENNLALVFTNTGTTTLGAANTYTGSTTISGGKVIVSGSLSGTATVSVASSATLASGTSGGSITTSATTGNAVDISGTLSPGDTAFAPITLTLDGAARLNFNSGAQLRLDVGAENSSDTVIFGGLAADRLFGSSNATLALTGVVDYASTYTVFLNVTTTGFLFAGITGYDSTNYNAVFARSGNDYQLSFVAVPEPGSLAALFGGVGLLAGLQRLRRKPGSR